MRGGKPRQPTVGEKLEALIERRASQLVETAASGEVPSDREVKELERLARLRDLSSAREKPRRLWPAAALFLLSLSLMTFLAFSRVADSTFQMQLKTKAVRIVGGDRAQSTERLELSSLGVLEGKDVSVDSELGPQSLGVPVEVKAAPQSGSDAQISLAPLTLSPGATLTLSSSPDGLSLSLQQPEMLAEASLRGRMSIAAGSVPREVREFEAPGLVQVAGSERDPIRLLTRPKSGPASILRGLLGSSLVFEETRRTTSLDAQADQELVSPILAGSVRMEDVGKEIPIRRGDTVRIDGFRGVVRELSFQGDVLSLDVVGRARSIDLRTVDLWRPLAPTWLEYLNTHHQLALTWGTSIYVFTLLLALFRWARWLK